MTEAPTRSYDDLPESDVATVLEVPLLWGGPAHEAASAVPQAGRHRARVTAVATTGAAATTGTTQMVVPSAAPSRRRTASGWTRHPVLQVLEVGVVSAVLVLVLFGLVLLALAQWMP